MNKSIFKNLALYLLFVIYCINAVKFGASWLFWVSAVLVALKAKKGR